MPQHLSGKTQIVGLIGWPVSHSVSPAMHNAAFDALGLDWRYVPLPVDAANPARIRDAVRGLPALGLRGANVTVPHKQNVIPLLDELTTADLVHGDKGYDSNAVRQEIEATSAAPNIPPKPNRRWKNCFSPHLDRTRNAIERMFGRLKDFPASPPATTGSPSTSSPQSTSPSSSATGYKSRA